MQEELVSLTELRELLAGEGRPPLSKETISQLVSEGMPKGSRGVYPAVKCLRFYITRLRTTVQSRSREMSDGRILELGEAQRRLTAAKAGNEEMTMLERQGKLIPLEIYEQHLTAMVITVRSRLLNMPSRLAGRLVGLTETREVKTVIDDSVKETLRALAKQGHAEQKVKIAEMSGESEPVRKRRGRTASQS